MVVEYFNENPSEFSECIQGLGEERLNELSAEMREQRQRDDFATLMALHGRLSRSGWPGSEPQGS